MFSHFYITKTGRGEINPGGLVYLKNGRDLQIKATPDKGHFFNGIQGLIKGTDYDQVGDIVTPRNKKTGDK